MAAHAKSYLTRERAQYLRRVKGARHAHAAMRAQDRTPGDEGWLNLAEKTFGRVSDKVHQAINATSSHASDVTLPPNAGITQSDE